MAMFDSLTGVGSRHRFQIEGRLLYETAFRSRHPLSVMMMDIDHFKPVNDTYGHDAGDAILRRCAQEWAKELRTTDLLARYGGEEFVILLPETSLASTLLLAERMRERTAQILHPEIKSTITVSIGVSSRIPNSGSNLDSLVLEADTALYESKRSGRNRVTHLEL
jgi:diguanylate cyclase (GGDEF)-like protein